MRTSLTVMVTICTIAAANAQSRITAQPVPSRLKNAGTYSFATGTWSHGNQETFCPINKKYVNSANTGYYGNMGAPVDLIWTDEGRMPSTASGGESDEYRVNGFSLYYCSSVAGAQNGGILFYESYTSCTDILGLTPAAAFAFTVPGGAGATACWLVTFDLTGTSLEFCISGDADGTFDGTSALDNFGWTLILNDQGSGGFNGPFLNGDPNNYPYGDGTSFQNPGAAYGTGLGTVDQFWLTDPTGFGVNGCFWFGGYASGNPFSSFGIDVYGDKNCSDSYVKYCTANSNSTGAPADLSAAGSSASSGTITMASAPVPNQPGIFFHAANQNQIPFGCSFLCATGGTVRGAVSSGVANVATYVYDNSDAKHSLGGFIGQLRRFQYWFRDPMNAANCGGQTFNTSNAVEGTILP